MGKIKVSVEFNIMQCFRYPLGVLECALHDERGLLSVYMNVSICMRVSRKNDRSIIAMAQD